MVLFVIESTYSTSSSLPPRGSVAQQSVNTGIPFAQVVSPKLANPEGVNPSPTEDFTRRATHSLTSAPTTPVSTVEIVVTTVGAGFIPARSGAQGSTQSVCLS